MLPATIAGITTTEMSKLLDLKQLEKQISKLSDDWFISGDNHLSASYEFDTYQEALGFIVCIAKVAEALDHHPVVTWGNKKIDIRVSSHDAGGLTKKDFELARRATKCLDL